MTTMTWQDTKPWTVENYVMITMTDMTWEYDNHVMTTWQPCQDHVTTMPGPSDNLVMAMWQPCQCYVTTMTVQCDNHDIAMWQPWQCNVTNMTVQCDNHDSAMWQPWQCNGTVKSKQSVTLLFFSTYGCQNLNLFSFLYAIFYIVIPCRRTEISKHNITLNYENMYSNKSIILLKH